MLMQMPGQRQTVFCRGLSLFGALLALALLGMIVLRPPSSRRSRPNAAPALPQQLTFETMLAAERRARIAVQQLTVLAADASPSASRCAWPVSGTYRHFTAWRPHGAAPWRSPLAQRWSRAPDRCTADFSAVDAARARLEVGSAMGADPGLRHPDAAIDVLATEAVEPGDTVASIDCVVGGVRRRGTPRPGSARYPFAIPGRSHPRL